jgi:hypothetical protein
MGETDYARLFVHCLTAVAVTRGATVMHRSEMQTQTESSLPNHEQKEIDDKCDL